MRDRDRIREAEPAVGVVLLVEHRFPASRYVHDEALYRDLIDSSEVFSPHVLRHAVALVHPNIDDLGVQAGLFAQLSRRGAGERLAFLDDSGDHVPVIVDRAVKHQEFVASADDDRGFAGGPQSAATAACSFAVASAAGVPAGK